MADRIFYNPEGYIEVIVEGDQTAMSFENLKADASEILDRLESEGKRRLGLIDLTHEGKITLDSNRAAMEVLDSLDYDRLALFGANAVLTEVVKGILAAVGKSNTKIFPDRQSALAWLLSPENPT